jgi:hypothetical protein
MVLRLDQERASNTGYVRSLHYGLGRERNKKYNTLINFLNMQLGPNARAN